jgi:hypothetical protein
MQAQRYDRPDSEATRFGTLRQWGWEAERHLHAGATLAWGSAIFPVVVAGARENAL